MLHSATLLPLSGAVGGREARSLILTTPSSHQRAAARAPRWEHEAKSAGWCRGRPGLTVVEVAQVAGVEEEVRSEQLPEAALARPEGQGCVHVQAAGPVRLSAQVVA